MESLEKLMRAYSHLLKSVSAEQSSTVRLVRSGDRAAAYRRLVEETGEAVLAARGAHRHDPTDKPALQRLQTKTGFDPAAAGVLLEASQVSYWYLVMRCSRRSVRGVFRRGLPNSRLIASALGSGARSARSVEELAAAIERNPSGRRVYAFVGRLMAAAGLPLELFARLDLMEMERKPYLEAYVRGL